MNRYIPAFAALLISAACAVPASDIPEAVQHEMTASETGGSHQTVKPIGFDCDGGGQVEELVCSDNELAKMDRELVRLTDLVRNDEGAASEKRKELGRSKSDFYRDIEECWKAIAFRQCVITGYAAVIARVRSGNAISRMRDAEGISRGPFAFRCDGFGALIGATFVTTDPGVVFLEWADSEIALSKTPTGSGSKYASRWENDDWVFRERGEEASFETSFGNFQCKREEIG